MASFALNAADELSFDDCVKLIQRQNPELEASKRSQRVQEYALRGAYSNFFPQLSASMSLSYGTGSSNLVGNNSLGAIGQSGQAGSVFIASLSAKQNIFSGWMDIAKVDQAKAAFEVASLNLENLKAQLSNSLKSAFAGLVYAQRAMSLMSEIRQRRERNHKLVALRFEGGRENKGSLLLAKAYWEQAEYDELQARNVEHVARAQLATVLGLDDKDSIRVKGDVPVMPVDFQIDPYRLVLETPSFQIAKFQEKSAEASVALARSGFFPQVNLNGSLGTNHGEANASNRWLIGFEVVFPFFSGGKDYYAYKMAKESMKGSTLTREGALRLGVARLEQTYRAYMEAVRKLEVDQSFVDAVGVRSKIAQERYNNGLMSFEDWDVIENDLVNREKALLQSRRDRVIAQSNWELAQGKGVLP